jgi:drug/metabolite transporter (DMT)-like permease
MGADDLALVGLYAALLFGARWLTVAALRLIPAHVATPLMNLQFVWMVGLGALIWGEVPDPRIYVAAAMVVAAGAILLWDEWQPAVARA